MTDYEKPTNEEIPRNAYVPIRSGPGEEPRNAKKKNKRRKHANLAKQRFVMPKDIAPIKLEIKADKVTKDIAIALNAVAEEQQKIRIFLQRMQGYREGIV